MKWETVQKKHMQSDHIALIASVCMQYTFLIPGFFGLTLITYVYIAILRSFLTNRQKKSSDKLLKILRFQHDIRYLFDYHYCLYEFHLRSITVRPVWTAPSANEIKMIPAISTLSTPLLIMFVDDLAVTGHAHVRTNTEQVCTVDHITQTRAEMAMHTSGVQTKITWWSAFIGYPTHLQYKHQDQTIFSKSMKDVVYYRISMSLSCLRMSALNDLFVNIVHLMFPLWIWFFCSFVAPICGLRTNTCISNLKSMCVRPRPRCLSSNTTSLWSRPLPTDQPVVSSRHAIAFTMLLPFSNMICGRCLR